MIAIALQVFLVLPALSVRLVLLVRLEAQDFQVLVDFQVQLELLEPQDRSEDLATWEIRELRGLPELKVIFPSTATTAIYIAIIRYHTIEFVLCH